MTGRARPQQSILQIEQVAGDDVVDPESAGK